MKTEKSEVSAALEVKQTDQFNIRVIFIFKLKLNHI